MLDRVGQALLDEPVDRQVDARRQGLRLSLDPQLDRQARLARLGKQAIEVLEAGLGCERRSLVGSAEDADHPPHLRERLPAGLLDNEQRFAFLLLMGTEEAARGQRLDRHHADAAADDIVQFARDARALVRDREPSLLDALLLGPRQPLLRLLCLVELAAEPERDRPRDGEDDGREDEAAGAALRVVGR